MKNLIFLILICLLGANTWAQTFCMGDPSGTFIRIIGNETKDEEIVLGHTPLPDGGYIIAGTDSEAALISRYSSNDELIMHRRLDVTTTGPDYVRRLNLDSDGKLIGVGKSSATNSEGTNFAFKYDYLSDNLEWVKKLSVPTHCVFEGLTENPDNGNYILNGLTFWGSGPFKGFLAELDRNTGAILWQQEIANDNQVGLRKLGLNDGNLYVVGNVKTSNSASKIRATAFKFEQDGDLLWSKYYLNDQNDIARTYFDDLIFKNDNLYAFSRGDLNGSSFSDFTLQMVSINPENGNMVFGVDYEIENCTNTALQNAYEMPDGFLVFASAIFGSYRYSVVLNIDNNGFLNWAKKIGQPGRNTHSGAIWYQDGFIFVMASSENIVNGNRDLIIAKMNTFGEIGDFCICNWISDIDVNLNNLSNGTFPLSPDSYNTSFSFQNVAEDLEPNLFLTESTNCEAITNTYEIDEIKNIKLYPNPAKDHLILELPDKFNLETNISIFNQLGTKLLNRILLPAELQSIKLQLSPDIFPNGVYWCVLKTEKHRITFPFSILK